RGEPASRGRLFRSGRWASESAGSTALSSGRPARHSADRGSSPERLRLSSLPLLFSNALDKARLDRQLCCAESEDFPCHIFRDTVKLKHHATWCHTARPVVNRTLTFTHTDFGRLRSYRQV